MTQWNKLADQDMIDRAKASLETNGITVTVVPDGAAAKAKVLEIIPAGAEVMNMTSMTLETTGIAKVILESGRYQPVRAQLNDETVPGKRKRELGAAPDWAIGSVHAITEDGVLFIASNTGSQLPAYAYGAGHVIWVASTKKIVKDREAARQRIYEHVLPQEAERANKAYNSTAGSNVSKLLMIAKEVQANRLHLLLVQEDLGF